MHVRLIDLQYETEHIPILTQQSGHISVDRILLHPTVRVRAEIILTGGEFTLIEGVARMEELLTQAFTVALRDATNASTTQGSPAASRAAPASVLSPLEARFERIAAALRPSIRPPEQ